MKQKERIFLTLKTLLLSVLLLAYLVPFILVVINSLKPTREFLENPLALPRRSTSATLPSPLIK